MTPAQEAAAAAVSVAPMNKGDREHLHTPLDPQHIAPTREERLFLVLSIFIGVISGLLVVAFRVAIEWIKILTLGSAPHPGQLRLIFMPAAAGLSRGARQRRQPDQGRPLRLQRLHLVQDGHRQVHYLGAGYRRGPLTRAGRPLAANRRGRRFRDRAPAPHVPPAPAHVRPHRRGGRSRRGFQRAHLGHSVRH